MFQSSLIDVAQTIILMYVITKTVIVDTLHVIFLSLLFRPPLSTFLLFHLLVQSPILKFDTVFLILAQAIRLKYITSLNRDAV